MIVTGETIFGEVEGQRSHAICAQGGLGRADPAQRHVLVSQDRRGQSLAGVRPDLRMSAAALLADNPTPTDGDLQVSRSENLGRHSGHHTFVKVVMASSAQDVAVVATSYP